ncbi:MAG: hypothetical protein CMJ53_00270 [Planctomycetaceae bacterium]|nr:hypothetical protein [Planctomycetaceae bacterium]
MRLHETRSDVRSRTQNRKEDPMVWLDLIAVLIFMILGAGSISLVLIGLPGTWLLIGLAVGLEFIQRLWAPTGSEWLIPWWVFIIAVVVAIVGEVLEFLAGALGAKKGGASKRGMVGSLIGGLIGTVAGTILIPIPIVGSLIGAIAGCGAGAVIGELTAKGEVQLKDTIKPAAGAVVGRILGTLAKVPCAGIAWVVLCAAALHEPLSTIFSASST